jgi:protein TonB
MLIVTLVAAGGFGFFQVLPKQSPSTEAGLPSADMSEASRAGPLDGLDAPGEVAVPSGGGSSLSAVGGPATAAAPRAPRQQAAPAPTPAPRTTASASQATPEPVISFRPPQGAAAPQPGATPVIATQPAPQPAAPGVTQPAPAPAPPPAAAPTATSDFVTPNWTRQPSAQQLSDAYPIRAEAANVAGRVTLECVIQNGGALACSPTSSSPNGYGFAEAGRSVSRFFRVNPANAEGYSIIGKRVRLTINFAASR